MGLVPWRHQAHIRQRVSLPGDFSFDMLLSSPLEGEGGSPQGLTDEGLEQRVQLPTAPSSGVSRHLLPLGEKGRNKEEYLCLKL